MVTAERNLGRHVSLFISVFALIHVWYDPFCLLLAHRTSSKQSRLKEYLAVESLPDLSIEEIEKMEKSCEGAYFQSLVSIFTVLGLLNGTLACYRFFSSLGFVFSGTFQRILGFHFLSHNTSADLPPRVLCMHGFNFASYLRLFIMILDVMTTIYFCLDDRNHRMSMCAQLS